MRFSTVSLVCALFVSLFAAAPADAYDRYMNRGPGKLVIAGYDTTSYFKTGTPHRGNSNHVVRWKGAQWRFASAGEAAQFRANPKAYAPQFGAYCTGGLSQQHVVSGHPRIFRLHKGKLYLFATEAGGRRFSRDPSGTIARAQAYWNTLGIKP